MEVAAATTDQHCSNSIGCALWAQQDSFRASVFVCLCLDTECRSWDCTGLVQARSSSLLAVVVHARLVITLVGHGRSQAQHVGIR